MVVLNSPFPDLDFPQKNILSYLFPNDAPVTDDIIWQHAENATLSLSMGETLQYIKRLGAGLQKLGLRPGDIVFICSPNHIYVPISYLGTVGATFAFSGANPAYTAAGTYEANCAR